MRYLLLATTAILAPTGALAQAEAPASGAAVEEIVVTAQRREERLQDVPISISAFSQGQLERANISSAQQLTQITPSLNMTQSSFSPQPTIRGIGTRGVTVGDESVVPIYIDGVLQPATFAAFVDLNNVERVEVLRGPQGALFGRNATGGAINIITEKPSGNERGRFSLSYGSFDEVEAKAYVSGGNDILSADLAYMFRKDDGYVRDLLNGGHVGATDNRSLRSRIRFTPSDSFEAILTLGQVYKVDGIAFATQPVNGNTTARRRDPNVFIPTGFYEVASDANSYSILQDFAALSATYRFDLFDLTSITGVQYNMLKNREGSDNDATAIPVSGSLYDQRHRSLVQELYATSTHEGPFSWVAGVTYYSDTSGVKPQISRTMNLTTGVVSEASNVMSQGRTESVALYGQGTYQFTDALSLTLGGRYTSEKKNFNIRNNRTGRLTTGSGKWEEFDPSAVIRYEFSPTTNVYAKAGTAFKAGVFPSSTESSTPVDPEQVTQYEVGLKADPVPWLRTNVAAYFTDYKNIQVNIRDPIRSVSTLQNAGAGEIYGIEAEAFASPIRDLNVRAGVSLLHAEYTEYEGAQISTPNPLGGNDTLFIDAAGKKMIRTPFFTANLGFDYTWPVREGEMTIALNAYYSGHSYWEASNRVKEPAYALVNGEVSWTSPDGRYKVALWGENLTDVERNLAVLSSATGDTRSFARPRSVGVRLSLNLD